MRGSEKTARNRPIRHQISGQISIVAAALMGTTFFLFFAFVVNTGMLVHAKINLQNAADVAAYAGAASQARHLENIGVLNYELRRQYKRFLFRYYVIGNLTRPNYPAGGEYQFGAYRSQANPPQFVDLGVPAVCLEFKKNDNYCKIFNLQAVTVPNNPFFLDAIGQALKEVLDNIEEIRKRNCSGLSQANILALYLWLYNTNPEGSGNLISSTFTDRDTQTTLRTLPAITKGLGVVPRNLITLQRIKTLEKIVNMPAERGVTADLARSLEQKPNPMTHERTVLAFKSVERTLGGSLFPEGKFQMDELLPSGPNPLLKLEPLFSAFNTYSTYIAATNDALTDCRQRLLSIPIQEKTLPVGVSKVGPTTYYAVRVRGTPNLLFNPFNLTLEAYAAARPFGARLGPEGPPVNLKSEFSRQKNPTTVAAQNSIGPMSGGVPNMAFRPGDELGLYNTALFRGLVSYILSGSGDTIDPNRLVQAEAIAALPNQAEYGRYIIPTDYNSPSDRPPNALDYKNYFVNGGFYSFYAPVSLDGGSNARGEVESILTAHPEPQGLSGLKNKLRTDLNNYFSSLGSNSGEGGEGLQIARVMDPIRDITGADVSSLAGTIIPKIANGELRPWFSGRNVAPFRSQNGRVGYSVKIVSFKSLQNSGVSVSDAESDPTPYIDH